ncbi:hypothetical protein J2X72_003018 [Phyllobacterium sp. 1468]|uniref:hypothetical protein n=1 Tax=Phyllobacterium sp. 1468 TaxID=2817759 RepID=UPI0028660BE2|nr:hypothetical protein [Phyllobacterium sp. 1468]MDR6634218.1 hypothetical protein [Phyllobacterium sp. 1468]
MPVQPTIFDSQDQAVIQWVNETGVGVGIACNKWADKTLQNTGTGTLLVQGSPNNTNWVTLKDSAGNSLSALAAGSAVILRGNPLYIRVTVSGGTQTITIAANRTRRR